MNTKNIMYQDKDYVLSQSETKQKIASESSHKTAKKIIKAYTETESNRQAPASKAGRYAKFPSFVFAQQYLNIYNSCKCSNIVRQFVLLY